MTLALRQSTKNQLNRHQAPQSEEERSYSPQYAPHRSFTINPEESKQKAELCKQFMEFGECPYQGRCKFAHGSHELLRNQQANMKYKTKECENFRKKWCCLYGKRCNFIHIKGDVMHEERSSSSVEWGLIR